MILLVLILAYFSKGVFSQELTSHCPGVFYYEPKTERNTWYGVLSASTSETLTGLWINVELDSKAELLGNWFGETYSSDNQSFRLTNPDYVLEAGPPVSIRFFVQYDPSGDVPRLKSIRINGRTVCSDKATVKPTTPKLHISKPHVTRHPSTGGGLSYDSNIGSNSNDDIAVINRPSSNYNYNRPNTGSSNENTVNNRPSDSDSFNKPSRGSDNNRPAQNNFNGQNNGIYTQDQYNKPTGSSINQDNFNSKPYGGDNTGSQSFDRNNRPSSDSSSFSDGYNRPNNAQVENNSHRGSTTNNYRDRNKVTNSDEDFFQGDFNLEKNDRTTEKPNNSLECGTVAYMPRPLITNGQDTVPGEWPWHAAIYVTKGLQLVYICGASLISDKFVLTAAHCVTRPRSNKMVEIESILVYFGKYNLKSFGPETQDRDISDIYVHPDFNSSMFFNDIAILKLSRPVKITDYVRPCCFWDEDTDIENLANKEGTVIGWGFDENKKISEKLMQAKMPIISTIKCIYSNRDFFSRFTFDKNFCAGFRNGTSVCNGDSGGSMVFPKKGTSGQSTVWQIRGVVSVGVALQSEGVCDTSQYVIFTDVAKHLKWINQILRS